MHILFLFALYSRGGDEMKEHKLLVLLAALGLIGLLIWLVFRMTEKDF